MRPPAINAAKRPAALALGGGLALGAYHLGLIETLGEAIEITAVAGASIGAVAAAIVAGNPPEHRAARLRAFWKEAATFSLAPPRHAWPLAGGILRHSGNWFSAVSTRLSGAPGIFRPRLEPGAWLMSDASLYDQAQLRDVLLRLADFDRLNTGAVRCCIAATDVETAELVLFDTAKGDRITPDHLLASGALMPNFHPVRIGGRLLGDGGFSANLPLEPFLTSGQTTPPPSLLIAADLFAADAAPPDSIEQAAARGSELKFAAQTRLRIEALERERRLDARLNPRLAGTDLLWLSYRAPSYEAGPERPFDFSRATLADRRAAGARDGRAALAALDALPPLDGGALRVTRIRAAADRTDEARASQQD